MAPGDYPGIPGQSVSGHFEPSDQRFTLGQPLAACVQSLVRLPVRLLKPLEGLARVPPVDRDIASRGFEVLEQLGPPVSGALGEQPGPFAARPVGALELWGYRRPRIPRG